MLSCQNILNSGQIAADIEEKLVNKWEILVEESVAFTFLYEANGNHATKLSTLGHVISKWHWKITFNFTEIVNNYWSDWETICQIVTFSSQFFLKLYIQFWNFKTFKYSGQNLPNWSCHFWNNNSVPLRNCA